VRGPGSSGLGPMPADTGNRAAPPHALSAAAAVTGANRYKYEWRRGMLGMRADAAK
jgi:hypothetical protein